LCELAQVLFKSSSWLCFSKIVVRTSIGKVAVAFGPDDVKGKEKADENEDQKTPNPEHLPSEAISSIGWRPRCPFLLHWVSLRMICHSTVPLRGFSGVGWVQIAVVKDGRPGFRKSHTEFGLIRSEDMFHVGH
jgi:hypothetical protein